MTSTKNDPGGILACEHGRQRRKCEVCERDEELAELRARLADAEKDRDSLHRVVKDEYAKREALESERDELRRSLGDALRPFLETSANCDEDTPGESIVAVTVGDCRRAAALVARHDTGEVNG